MIIYLWIYTLFLSLLWWIFVVIKLNTIKYSYFLNNFNKITSIVWIILIFLSIIWYIIIFINLNTDTVSIKNYNDNNIKQINY